MIGQIAQILSMQTGLISCASISTADFNRFCNSIRRDFCLGADARLCFIIQMVTISINPLLINSSCTMPGKKIITFMKVWSWFD